MLNKNKFIKILNNAFVNYREIIFVYSFNIRVTFFIKKLIKTKRRNQLKNIIVDEMDDKADL